MTYLDSIRVIVQEQYARAGNFLRLHHGLQIGEEAHVFRHVRRKNLVKALER